LLIASNSWAQDGHRENHDWYKGLSGPGGGSCCSGDEVRGDCRVAQAHQRDDGFWEVFIHGGWVIVPPSTILADRLNRQPLQSHICEREGYIYCFLRGGAGG